MKYRFLTQILKIFVYSKRGVWWVGRKAGGAIGRLLGKIWHLTTYLRYRFNFKIKKAGLGKHSGLFTTRLFFQIVGLLTLLGAAYPHTKFYVSQELGYDWRYIKMYNLTKNELELEQLPDLEIEEGSANVQEAVNSWRQEVIEPDNNGFLANTVHSDSLALSVSGRAVVKPLLMPGSRPRTRIAVEEYTVRAGDSLLAIAAYFGVSTETILWENNLTAKDILKPGKVLRIPPVTGVMHTVVKGDTLKKIIDTYKAKSEEVISFNKLNPDGGGLVAGNRIMVPGGKKPSPPPVAAVARTTGRSGVQSVSRVVRAQGTPGTPFDSGFIWPTTAWVISRGIQFGHNGLDIATNNGSAFGRPTFAAQDGVVKYAGWQGGYGNLIIIDHGSGYETYYGHHSAIYVVPGQRVERGEVIGAIGSTGNSSGPHLHFEIRINKKTLNPLDYVRPPANPQR